MQNNPSIYLNPDQLISNDLTVQKKTSDQYVSVFDENLLKEKILNNNNKNNFITPGANTENLPVEYNIYYFEELLLDYYIKIISEFFPNLKHKNKEIYNKK